MPAALASVWSKRVTKASAFASMLSGFVVSAVLKIVFAVGNISVPIYLDPFFIGLAVSIVALIIGSLLTKVTNEEKKQRELLFVVSDHDKDPKEVKKTKIILGVSIPLGLLISVLLIVLWVLPLK
ncbi:MAG: hypothetical protein MJ237_09085 [bacterium]|nr:hypothetical protein [bacterium]